MESSGYYPTHHSFNWGLLVGDPFALATVSVAVIGWVIAIASSIVADIDGPYPSFSWWGIAYQLLVIAGVTYVIGANAVEPYKLAVVGFTSTALVYTTNSTNNLVYTGRAADAAAAAGHILLSITNVLWMFYFGTTADAAPHAFVDFYALHRDNPRSYNDSRSAKYPPPAGPASGSMSQRQRQGSYATQMAQVAHSQQGGNFYDSGTATGSIRPQQQMFTSAQLNGFETTSLRGQPGFGPGTVAGSSVHHGSSAGVSRNGSGLVHPISSSVTNLSSMPQDDMGALDMPTEYPLRARAIYSYDANPDDANEISFVKSEILEVSDVSGRWWQARRANGEVGICPSNYVQLIE
ncbi:hypothetical protein V1512DRAFT_261960 [Lipomyces arxii]|uniref:uncharacterized protein n=1 Tax=Lipomyces arxii TaxID=56418 RepID=UPI0034CFB485